MANGKAPARRNAELAILIEAARWRKEVARYAPDRLDEFDKHLRKALENPTKPQPHD